MSECINSYGQICPSILAPSGRW